ncbi:hypothetical protein [Elizabethkingia ursingii]|jgi:hypothetical protein|uniref:Uncharacterized protein n=1 Tax=Elizabethkingia ursingii TaxID=1756150 RepID=A0AAJ3TPJ8_9FLAO|nr:hypothetical protein [Elizabethkingia ursingii]AQX09717.1 hypothetical protein BBD34_14200 [Elizabethkingia ursingii]OPB75449.1 hypothetical protein BAY32_07950 [Elizabethkingia ursingii]
MKNNFLIIAAIILIGFVPQLQGQSKRIFSGNFSSEGDVTAKGIMTMELTQSGAKIEGVSNYKTNDGMLSTGMLSVNGYTKDNIGYIRFRDQRGSSVADGSITYQDASTLYFKQTTTLSTLPMVSYLYKVGTNNSNMSVEAVANYSGKYSNEGDTTANGIIYFEISQKGTKVEGIANYKTFDQQLNTGILSVNGYMKEGVAYIRFRDQKGVVIADGALSTDKENIIFRQTTLSNLLPHYAVLYR